VNRRIVAAVAVAAAVVAFVVAVVRPSGPSPPTRPAVGAYVGPASVAALDAFGTATGTRPTVAFDFADGGSWEAIASPTHVLDAWTPWLQASGDRRLVLSVPMLARGDGGHYDDPSFDAFFARLARDIASRRVAGQVTIRLGWEMNGDWFPWGDGNAAGYRRMWRRVVAVFRTASTAFRFDWSPNGFSGRVTDWYPGDDVVDMIGIDLYDIAWRSPGGDPLARWRKLVPNLARQAAFARAHGKPAVLDEWALWTSTDALMGGGGDDPTYVTNVLRWTTEHRYLYHAYFDVPSGGIGTTLRQNPKGLAAYRAET
jgi:hypothetical protein